MATDEAITTTTLDQLRAIVRAQLADLERKAESLSVEQLAAGLTAAQFDVHHILAARPEADQYAVSQTWTEKGLRHAWAQMMFWETMHWEYDEPANVTPIKPAETAANVIPLPARVLDAIRSCMVMTEDEEEQMVGAIMLAIGPRLPPDLIEPDSAL